VGTSAAQRFVETNIPTGTYVPVSKRKEAENMSGESRMDRGITAYARWILRWRWPVLAALIALSLLAASGLGRLAFATNYRVFFGKGNPELAAFEAVQNIYTKNDSILFVVAPEG
jgi:predicted RND superfamily exporter protein